MIQNIRNSLNLHAIYTDLRIELGQIKRDFLQAPSQVQTEFAYRWKVFQQIRKRPQLLEIDRPIVEGLKTDGAFVTSLDRLSTHSNPETTDRMLQAAHRLLPTLSNTCASDSELENVSNIWSINNHVIQPSAEEIVWKYPDIYLWGLDERLLTVIENYIGLPVSYFGPSFRKDIPNGKVLGTRRWHLDGEDRRMVKVLVYLNDVDDSGGPFEYIPKRLTPSRRALRKLRNGFDDGMKQVVPRSQWQACPGACGTVIFADTAQIWHHGKIPLTERVAIIYTYTSRVPEHPEAHGQNHSQYYFDGVNKLTPALSQRQVDSIYWK